MRLGAVLLLAAVLATGLGLPAHAEPFRPGQTLDQEQVAQVTAAALAFMAPRILDPIPVAQLAMWGLRGLTTLDPRLSPVLSRRQPAPAAWPSPTASGCCWRARPRPTGRRPAGARRRRR